MVGVWKVFRGKDRKWYFHLKSGNGKVICQSEGYSRKSGALKGIRAVRMNA